MGCCSSLWLGQEVKNDMSDQYNVNSQGCVMSKLENF